MHTCSQKSFGIFSGACEIYVRADTLPCSAQMRSIRRWKYSAGLGGEDEREREPGKNISYRNITISHIAHDITISWYHNITITQYHILHTISRYHMWQRLFTTTTTTVQYCTRLWRMYSIMFCWPYQIRRIAFKEAILRSSRLCNFAGVEDWLSSWFSAASLAAHWCAIFLC